METIKYAPVILILKKLENIHVMEFYIYVKKNGVVSFFQKLTNQPQCLDTGMKNKPDTLQSCTA